MKLRITTTGAPEEDGFSTDPDPFPAGAPERFERILGEELPLLCRVKGLGDFGEGTEAELSVSFLNQAGMRAVNNEYRGVDEPTDVLSFPLWEDGESSFGFTPEVFPLGDIVICPEETEKEHAPMERLEALCLVLAHGFLHLLGWDHDTPEKEADMWGRQELLKAGLMNVMEEVS